MNASTEGCSEPIRPVPREPALRAAGEARDGLAAGPRDGPGAAHLRLAPFLADPGDGAATRLDGDRAFSILRSRFTEAASGRPLDLDAGHRLGGRTARVRVAGEALSGYLGRPLAHLRDERLPLDRPDLTVDAWDEGETGVPCPECAIAEILGIDGQITTSPDGRYIGYQRARSYLVYDRAASHIVSWSRYDGVVGLYERGRPLHVALSLWLGDHDLQVVHAGLVARDRTGVLFTGMGGRGKSTSALTCLAAGMKYLGDDYIAMAEAPDGSFVGHSLYNSSHLEPHHLERFPRLKPHGIPPLLPQEDKTLVLLDDVFPGQCMTSAPIRAIALPGVEDRETSRIRPVSPAEALKALAPTTILMIPGQGRAGFGRLAALCSAVPCYQLELGRDLDSIPAAVNTLIDEVEQS
jgi:hypothetical protein